MKLADLDALEAEYTARGWRVAFQRHVDDQYDADCWVDDALTQDDGNGFPTPEAAHEVLRRMEKYAAMKRWRSLRVIGPDGEGKSQEHSPSPVPEATIAEGAAPTAAAIITDPVTAMVAAGVGSDEGPLTLLARGAEYAIVGDAQGRAMLLRAERVEALAGAGRAFQQPRYTSFGTMLIGDRALEFERVAAGNGSALAASVAFMAHAGGDGGVWFVKVEAGAGS